MSLLISLFTLLASASLPFQFTYDGKVYKGFEGTIDGTLRVSAVRESHPEFSETEYTVWFENIGDKPSDILEDIYALKTVFKGRNPVLRGCLGDIDNFYSPYTDDFSKGDVFFESNSGRATHGNFPYFDLVHGKGGTRLAIGWAGTWDARFHKSRKGIEVSARSNPGFRAVLLPGEKVRTGLIVLLDYDSREEHVGVNRWRAWYMKHIMPKANAEGDSVKPFWTFNFAQDTGLENPDASVSETYFTWQRTLAVLKQEKLLPDFRWIDAGWYCNPDLSTSGTGWWDVGTWTLDESKWPGDSFRESNDACHELGLKTLLWFEPERITNLEAMVKNFGYKPEWASNPNESWITSYIGNPDCFKWTLDRITGIMEACGIDLYREDNNIDHINKWAYLERREEAATGLPRRGMIENRQIQAHYALWDAVIDFCRRTGKCTFLDSCASGGGRNDIEGMKRGFPILRSDYDRGTVDMRLSQSSEFCKWIPFHGASTKDTPDMLTKMLVPPDTYITRASLLPVMNYNAPVSHDPSFDFDAFRESISLWKSCNHLLTKDFYHLTEWHGPTDTEGWTAFAYYDPETGEGILTAFRQQTCISGAYVVKLPFAQNGVQYSVKDDDSGKEWRLNGDEMLNGLTLTLPEPRSSLLWRIKELK